MKMVGHLENS